MSWREDSMQIIDKHFRSIKEAQPELSDNDILRMVSLHYYPYGERRNHPYQQWLKAMADYRRKMTRPTMQEVRGPLFESR